MRLFQFLCCLIGLFPISLIGQVTTASIKGKVIDSQNKEPLIGVNVTVVDQKMGTEYGTITSVDGTYILPNLNPGGPYKITFSYIGYETKERVGIYLHLGQATTLDMEVETKAETLDEVVVTFDNKNKFSGQETGISTNVGKDQLQNLPSLTRSIQDMTRLSPQGNANTFAGSNYRFNNLSIDGASNNDILGFQDPASGAGGSVASGTPGSLAGTQPISLDAIGEVQVSLAPFDVSQGNFTGANLNVVTRRGSNEVEGSIYAFGHNQNLTGKSLDENRTKLANFKDYQLGARLGFPIIKNKLFAFVNYDLSFRSEPALNIPGTSSSNIPLGVARAVENKLITDYGYDPGTFELVSRERKSDKVFVRLDYNLAKNQQISFRHNYVKARLDNLDRSQSITRFTTNGYEHRSSTHSSVLEFKNLFRQDLSHKLILGYNSSEENREWEGDIFPHLEIKYNSANTIFAGPYREASIYGASLNTFQLIDQVNLYKGKHTFTAGTHNEFYDIQYRFLTAWNGRWEYKSVDAFLNDEPKRIRGVYNRGNNDFNFNRNNPSADFRVFLLSFYVQDEFQATDQLKLTAGLRYDVQLLPDAPPLSEEVKNTPQLNGFNNQVNSSGKLNPRFGFNYSFSEQKDAQLRGGVGLFTGRIPFAWYAYIYYINGIDYGNIDLKPNGTFPIEENLANLANSQPGLTEVNLIDDEFDLPRTFRSSLAFDKKFENGFSFSIEGLYSKTLKGIEFANVNLLDQTTNLNGVDKRPYYFLNGNEKKVNQNFTNAFLLTNTNKGYQYNLSLSISKEFGNIFKLSSTYTYGKSKDLFNGVRNSFASNFNVNQSVNSNNTQLAYSNFDLRHRVIVLSELRKQWSPKVFTNITAFFSAAAGAPFSYTINGDINKDNSSKNDLPFIPANQEDIILLDITDGNGTVVLSAAEQWTNLNQFIENDAYLKSRRGKYAERNGGRTPWNYNMDVRFLQRLILKNEHQIEFTLDIINFLNLVNRDWGKQYFVPNVTNASFQLIDFEGLNANQEPTYNFVLNEGIKPYEIDNLKSRWTMQLGLRYSF